MAKAMADKGTFVLTFGRFNPPTKGHEVVFDAIETAGKKYNTRNMGIFTSQSTQDAKNPLSYRDKVKFIRKAHPNVRVYENREIKTLFDAVGWAFDQGYSKVVIVLGSDRIPAFKGSIERFVKKEFPGKKVVFEQAGATRSEGSKGVAGVSGTKVRQAVKDNDFKAFKDMISDSMSVAQKKQLFQMLQKKSKALSEGTIGRQPGAYTMIQIKPIGSVLDGINSKRDMGSYMWHPDKKLSVWVPHTTKQGSDIDHFQFVATYPKEFGLDPDDLTVRQLSAGFKYWDDKVAQTAFKNGWIRARIYSISGKPIIMLHGIQKHLQSMGRLLGKHLWSEDVVDRIDINTGPRFDSKNEATLMRPIQIRRFLKSGRYDYEGNHPGDKEFRESVAFAIDIPNTFSQQVILKNPSWGDILKMMKGGSTKVRGFFNKNDIYCWDAAHFVHSQAISHLRMSTAQFDIFFKFVLNRSREIDGITTFSKMPGDALFEPEYSYTPETQIFMKHANKLGWKISKNGGSTLNYFEQDEMILPQKSHITIHQLDNTTFDAKIDTGNNSYCAMHADNIQVSGNKKMVTFVTNGKTYTAPIVEFVTIASSMGQQQSRVVVQFDVHFANKHYTDVKFSLTDRSNKEFPILLGTQFLSQTNVLVKAIAENVDRYQSLESLVRNQLIEAKIYPKSDEPLFDKVDRMSSNNWYNYGGMFEARWLYFPKSKMHVFWASGFKIHVEIIALIMREYPDEVKNETDIYAGFATRHPLDKNAISLSLDHAYTIKPKIDGSIKAAYPPQLSESELAKIMKSAFGIFSGKLYIRKTTGGRSSGGGRGFTEEYAKVGFTDQNRAKVLQAYKAV